MKNKQTTLTNPATLAFLIPLSMKAVNERLDALKNTPAHEIACEDFQIHTAHRNAWCDLKEAEVSLELKKIGAAEKAPSRRRFEISCELLEIEAARKLGKIFDSLEHAASELGEAARHAKPCVDRMVELRKQRSDADAELQDLRSRDIQEELAIYENMHDELRRLTYVINNGRWLRTSNDFKKGYFADEVQAMKQLGRYAGEPTREAVDARVAEIQEWIKKIDERLENQLTPDEYRRVSLLVKCIEDIDADLLEDLRYSKFEIVAANSKQASFAAILEASRISAESVLDVYTMTRASYEEQGG